MNGIGRSWAPLGMFWDSMDTLATLVTTGECSGGEREE